MNFDDPKPDDRRVMQTIYLRPSLRDAIDRDRAGTKLTRSAWIEQAIKAKLAKLKETKSES